LRVEKEKEEPSARSAPTRARRFVIQEVSRIVKDAGSFEGSAHAAKKPTARCSAMESLTASWLAAAFGFDVWKLMARDVMADCRTRQSLALVKSSN
jgi:hypothetical protein